MGKNWNAWENGQMATPGDIAGNVGNSDTPDGKRDGFSGF
jgi:hypothetical protein